MEMDGGQKNQISSQCYQLIEANVVHGCNQMRTLGRLYVSLFNIPLSVDCEVHLPPLVELLVDCNLVENPPKTKKKYDENPQPNLRVR